MFMNDVETTDSAFSPLKHDVKGRFSRKGKIVPADPVIGMIIRSIIVCLFSTFLFASDFILFAGSGNLDVFNNSFFPVIEVVFIIVGFMVISLIISFALSKYVIAQGIYASLISFLFVYILFNQFSQINHYYYIGTISISLKIILSIVFAAITFLFIIHERKLYGVFLLVSVFMLFLHIYTSYMYKRNPMEFMETHNSQEQKNEQDELYVHFYFPNLIGYPYISSLPYDIAQTTKDIMLGFYQTNNFTFYPIAYSNNYDYLDNMVGSLNPSSLENENFHKMKTRLLSEYWRFHNLRREYVYLMNNEVYDLFRERGYQISAYKSRDFDLCNKQHKNNVERCIEKVNQPINIYDTEMNTLSKTNILLTEWLASTNLFNDMSTVYTFLSNIFLKLDKVPMIGINYNNLYVINSIKTFDILSDHIIRDNGKQAYFVFVDLPSNMYVYDEYCKLLPTDKWYNMSNMPWINTDYSEERIEAYMKQTQCLYGKMQSFLDKLKDNNKLNNAKIVMQGVSGVNNFQNHKISNYVDDFMTNKIANLAVYDSKNIKFKLDNSFCSTKSLIHSILYKTQNCKTDNTILSIHEQVLRNLQQNINQSINNIKHNQEDNFRKWYNQWHAMNPDPSEIVIGSKHLMNKKEIVINEETAIDLVDDFDEFGLD